MGLFDKFKKKKTEPDNTPEHEENKAPLAEPEQAEDALPPMEQPDLDSIDEEPSKDSVPKPEDTAIKFSGDKVLAFALLNDNTFDLEEFKAKLKEDWGIEPEMTVRNNGLYSVSFMIAGMNFVVTHMPAPVPNHEAERVCRYNYLWRNAEETVAQHKSFLVVGLLQNPCKDKIKTCIQFSKVCGTLMAMQNACAMYMGGQNLVIHPQEYRKHIQIMKDAEAEKKRYLPISLWVFIGLAKGEHGGYGYTFGLKDFGKKEIEVLDRPIPPMQMYQMLNMIAYTMVVNQIELKDGDKIRLDQEHFVIMQLSEGVMVKGETFKMIFPDDQSIPTAAEQPAPIEEPESQQ